MLGHPVAFNEYRRASVICCQSTAGTVPSWIVGGGRYGPSMANFAVRLVHGPAWDAGRPIRAQDGWDEHAAFMDGLVEDGFIVLGGPVGDWEQTLHAVESADENEIRARLALNPWASAGLLQIGPIEPGRSGSTGGALDGAGAAGGGSAAGSPPDRRAGSALAQAAQERCARHARRAGGGTTAWSPGWTGAPVPPRGPSASAGPRSPGARRTPVLPGPRSPGLRTRGWRPRLPPEPAPHWVCRNAAAPRQTARRPGRC